MHWIEKALFASDPYGDRKLTHDRSKHATTCVFAPVSYGFVPGYGSDDRYKFEFVL